MPTSSTLTAPTPRPPDGLPADTRPADTRPGGVLPGDTRPADTRPGGVLPGCPPEFPPGCPPEFPGLAASGCRPEDPAAAGGRPAFPGLPPAGCLPGEGASPAGAPPGEKALGEKVPGEKAPGGEAPGEKALGGEAPGGEAPGGEAPGGEAPGFAGWGGGHGVPLDLLAFDLFGAAGPGGGAGAGPGPEEAPLLSQLLGVAGLDDEGCLALMDRANRAVARWQGLVARLMARFAVLRPPDADERGAAYSEFAADEIAAVLDVSPTSARNRLDIAYTLAVRLPATLDALEAGEIDYARARALEELTEPLGAEQARQVEAKVLARGRRDSYSAFRQAARRAVLRADPAGAEQRRGRAQAGREVEMRPREDGMAALEVTQPADVIEAIFQRLTALARQLGAGGMARVGEDPGGEGGEEDPRTLDQRRADVAAALLLGAETADCVPVEVHVTIPATTLLGLAEDPGELEGYGPIPAGMARELAENGVWRRIITDPVDGTVLDVGRRRFPTAGLARHIRERDRRCRFPGCARPARKADIDHTRRHTDGGETHDGQLEVLCRHHHRLKDGDGTRWTLTQPAPGHLEWTSPTGRVFKVGPTPADHFPPLAPDAEAGGAGTRAGSARTARRGLDAEGAPVGEATAGSAAADAAAAADAEDDPWGPPVPGMPPPF